MNRLLIIDGNAVLHRAYHAIPPLTAPDGSMVNAVYGFAAMLLRLHHDLQPTHIAVAFDRAAPTFRKKLFEGYQSKRPKMEDNLVSQIPKVHSLVDAFGIPIFEKDGFEADDVIGTLALQASRRQGIKVSVDQVIIVTGDRDILQLVEDDRVLAYLPVKGLSEGKIYHEQDVVVRLGVLPKLIPDLKGLMGDGSDNYPGVEGIGPKTAIDLINKYGSVENLYHMADKGNWGDIKIGIKNKLIKGRDMAFLSKDLATIRTNVELNNEIKEISTLNTQRARETLSSFHFHSLLKRLGGDINVQIKEEKKQNEQQQLF